jgi:two-component system phosphate regulon sensor histidine kinase PhoR
VISRRMNIGFWPSASCIDASADCEAASGGVRQSKTGDLLRTVDFYTTVLAIASHDLRQPLQAIVSAHDLLARRLTAGPEREYLERSEQASNQLEETLDQLVEALQLQRHAIRIDPEPVQTDPILQQIARQLDGSVRRKGIEYRTIRSRTVIMSQPLLLGGILRNLARNAVDHTPPGGRVLVGCRRLKNSVRIEVHDTGEGIPPDKLQSIFEPFFRVDATRSEGLGLGLFIVKRGAYCLGHEVELHSAVGRGSCFSLVARAASC